MKQHKKQKHLIQENYKKLGIVFIFLGLIFATETFFKIRILYKVWPVIITILGMGYIGIFYKRESREGFFLGIGVYLILFSFLALYCNFTSWKQLSFLWPLFVVFLGISFIAIVIFKLKNKLLLFLGLIMVSISITFFLTSSIHSKFWWSILIFLGISILVMGRRSKPENQ